MSKARIYIAIATFHPLVGGAETQALAQARVLRERGYDATILTFKHKQAWPAHDTIAGVPVIRVAGLFLGGRDALPHKLQQILYLLALIVMGWTLWWKRRHYDVLHVYQLSLLTLPAALACRLTGKPMLIAVRSTGSGKVSGSHTSSSLLAGMLDPNLPWLQIDAQSWVDGDLEGLVRMGKPFVHLAHALLLRIRAVVIVLSTRMQSYLTAHDFTIPDTRLIPNGVDIAHFYPTSLRTDDKMRSQTVICVSKLRYEKGIDVLLQAWHLVQQQMPAARLILVGSGPIQAQLTNLAEALGISESVEFAGLQSNIVAQLQRGALSVLPSRWEGMPNAVLEAMACGLPCVATRVSGSEDIIEQGVNGLLVEVEDYKGMAEALLTFLRDPDLMRQCGQAARATTEQHYALDHITDRYIALYHELLARKGSVSAMDTMNARPYRAQ